MSTYSVSTKLIISTQGVYHQYKGMSGFILRGVPPLSHRKLHNKYFVRQALPLSTIKDWDLLHQRHFGVVFARLLCSAGITNENEIQFSGSPTPRVSNDVTLATPTHSVRQYGFFSEPPRRRQMPKSGNLKRSESLLFSGDIESLEPSKF